MPGTSLFDALRQQARWKSVRDSASLLNEERDASETARSASDDAAKPIDLPVSPNY